MFKKYLLLSFIANIEISLEAVWIYLKYFGHPRRDVPMGMSLRT